ncbi:MAG: glycosyltransferase family 2 protein [Anaerolineae bacterium]|nr:glycosyltransferase family 2 protein [Anaerolineae bacterium]
MTTLAAIILCHNELDHLQPCIETVRFADDVLVFVDANSPVADEVVRVAENAGARAIRRPFDDYARHRNAALEAVESNWVLFVDVDERVPPELAAEIRATIETGQADGYGIPRFNYIFGRLTRHTGWYPDYQTRLLRRGRARYDPARPVHEVVLLDGPRGTLQQPLIHYNYRDLAHFIAKQRRYAEIDAGILFEEGLRPRPHNFILQPLRQFRWRFFTLQGYRDGLHGLWLSLLMAWYEWLKYRKLAARWRQIR